MRSKLLSLLVVCGLAAALFAGPAAAVDSSAQDLPDEAAVGGEVEVTFELTDLYTDFEQWTLEGETELQDVTWTVQFYDQAGSQVSQTSTDGQQLSTDVSLDDDVDRIEVRVTGTAPPIDNYSYQPPDRFAVANFTQARSGGNSQAIDSYRAHHYTDESDEARAAIDDARDAINGSLLGGGEGHLRSAVSSYENANFENAIDSAEQAESAASRNGLIATVALGVGALLVLALLGVGGYRVYRSRQQGPSRLK